MVDLIPHFWPLCYQPSPNPIVIAAIWGDGSGIYMGGTFFLVSFDQTAQSDEEWWMGIWANLFTSSSFNWKELRNLVNTL
eukprot:10086695-Ditylum_brightwellii.AAC.1